MTEIAELIERLEKATGPDRDMDYRLFETLTDGVYDEKTKPGLFWREGFTAYAAEFTKSYDSALALLGCVLPGWSWHGGSCFITDDAQVWPDFNSPVHGERLRQEFPEWLTPNREWHQPQMEWIDFTDVALNPPGRPAIALCISILIAVERINELKADGVTG